MKRMRLTVSSLICLQVLGLSQDRGQKVADEIMSRRLLFWWQTLWERVSIHKRCMIDDARALGVAVKVAKMMQKDAMWKVNHTINAQ